MNELKSKKKVKGNFLNILNLSYIHYCIKLKTHFQSILKSQEKIDIY